jgi:hypothetical protein
VANKKPRAEALVVWCAYGTAEAVPFLQRLFSKKKWNAFKGLNSPDLL